MNPWYCSCSKCDKQVSLTAFVCAVAIAILASLIVMLLTGSVSHAITTFASATLGILFQMGLYHSLKS